MPESSSIYSGEWLKLKYLVEQYPQQFVAWLLTTETTDIQILKTELSLEPIRADAVVFLQIANRILHIEFQTLAVSNPPLPLRMLDYWVRLRRQYNYDVDQVVIFLTPTNAEAAFIEELDAPNTRHRYRVIRIWEQDPEPLLASPALLPLAALARTNSPEALLQTVAAQVGTIASVDEQRNVSACVQLIAGLKFDKSLIHRLFREEVMRESVIYQEIVQQSELRLIMRLLNRRIGVINSALQTKIQSKCDRTVRRISRSTVKF